MTTTQQFSKICSYQNRNFKEWFGGMPFPEGEPRPLYSTKVLRSMNDGEIISELNPGEVSLNDIYRCLESLDKSMWSIFYCKDKNGVLRAVRVYWSDDGWGVDASSVEDRGWWGDGFRVFSRNSFENQDYAIKAPSPSDALSLEARVSAIERWIHGVKDQLL